MLKRLLTGLRATLVVVGAFGIAFPILMTIVGQVFFSEQANGSLVRNAKGTIIGSSLIGQTFNRPEYFHPRPSAAGSAYAAEASSGSNWGPTSNKLINGDRDMPGVKQLAIKYREENQLPDSTAIPVDAVTRSGSGLDPHISPANALLQASRVAKVRNIPIEEIIVLIKGHTEPRQIFILGEPCVNVLLLNIALDQLRG